MNRAKVTKSTSSVPSLQSLTKPSKDPSVSTAGSLKLSNAARNRSAGRASSGYRPLRVTERAKFVTLQTNARSVLFQMRYGLKGPGLSVPSRLSASSKSAPLRCVSSWIHRRASLLAWKKSLSNLSMVSLSLRIPSSRKSFRISAKACAPSLRRTCSFLSESVRSDISGSSMPYVSAVHVRDAAARRASCFPTRGAVLPATGAEARLAPGAPSQPMRTERSSQPIWPLHRMRRMNTLFCNLLLKSRAAKGAKVGITRKA
mmetsp:Transcript_68335/g.189089  ORF Transcript_68335/g.189089 Transcript_68335/m.189089 type:complete len:259 (-) Transcript_68335:462-1238(-)